jgi:hypothetical protein
MLLLSHVITGAVIGQKVHNPYLVSSLALASHFVLDWVPHWSYDVPNKFDVREFVKITPDALMSIIVYIVFLFSYPEQWLVITLGVGFAILPDFLTLTHYIPGLKVIFKKFNAWHGKIQVHDEKWLGLLTQAVYIGMLLIVLLAIK